LREFLQKKRQNVGRRVASRSLSSADMGPARVNTRAPEGSWRAGRVGAGVLVLATVAALAWSWPRRADDAPYLAPAQAPRAARQVVTTPAGLQAIATAAGHSVFWAGEIPNRRYEVTQAGGSVFIRYIRRGTDNERPQSDLVVTTQLFINAFSAVQAVARSAAAIVRHLPRGGLVVAARSPRTQAGFAYRGSHVEADVYDPVPGHALGLVMSGQIREIRP